MCGPPASVLPPRASATRKGREVLCRIVSPWVCRETARDAGGALQGARLGVLKNKQPTYTGPTWSLPGNHSATTAVIAYYCCCHCVLLLTSNKTYVQTRDDSKPTRGCAMSRYLCHSSLLTIVTYAASRGRAQRPPHLTPPPPQPPPHLPRLLLPGRCRGEREREREILMTIKKVTEGR